MCGKEKELEGIAYIMRIVGRMSSLVSEAGLYLGLELMNGGMKTNAIFYVFFRL